MNDNLNAPQIASGGKCLRCEGILSDSSSVTLDNGRSYCAPCLEEVGLYEFAATNQPIREDYNIGFWRGILLGLYTGLVLTTVIAIGLFTMFLLLYVAFLMGGVKANPAQAGELTRLLRVFAFFFAFAWAFVGVIGLPMGLFGTLIALRRTIQAKDNSITYDAGLRHVTLPLSECRWQVLPVCIDACTILSLNRPSIIVATSKEFIVCGFSSDRLGMWKSYLSLAIGPATPNHNWFKSWKKAAFHLIFATVLGWLIGGLLQAITGHPMWTSAAMFLGTLDGLVSGFFVLLRGHPKTDPAMIKPWLWSLIFAALGVKICIGVGLPGLIGGMIGNGLIGWFLGRTVHHQVTQDAASRALTQLPDGVLQNDLR